MMKTSHYSFLTIILLLFACGNSTRKESNSNNNTIDSAKVDTPSIKKEDPKEKVTRNPNAYFKITALTKVENQDARIGTDSESMVELWIDQTKIDEFKEYGDGDLFDDGLQANVNSEMSEKIYVIDIKDSTLFKVDNTMIYEGEEKSVWNKTYTKTKNGWKMTKCKGECD